MKKYKNNNYQYTNKKENKNNPKFLAKKKFGQNFLTSPDIPRKIAANCGADKSSGVLEIGPGKGILTAELSKIAKKVCAVEIDRELEPILGEKLKIYDNIEVIFDDILNIDLNSIIKAQFGETPIYVCANLPYYITTPILIKLLEAGNLFKGITIMVQREVADRLCAEPNSPNYGSITAVVNYYSNIKKLFNVPAGCFTPRPKVDSAVIKLDIPKEKSIIPKDEKLFFEVIKSAFAQRRKTFANNLFTLFSNKKKNEGIVEISKDRIIYELGNLGFQEGIRGEKLGIKEFCIIADRFYEIISQNGI